MKVISSSSNKQNEVMASGPARRGPKVPKSAQQPANGTRKPTLLDRLRICSNVDTTFGPSRNCLATRTSARPLSTLMSSTKEAEACGAPSMSCESSYTVCISRRPSRWRQRRFYDISGTSARERQESQTVYTEGNSLPLQNYTDCIIIVGHDK